MSSQNQQMPPPKASSSKRKADDVPLDREASHKRVRNEDESQAAREIIAQNNSRQSPLLRLPGEIRNLIYEYALANNVIVVNDHAPNSSMVYPLPGPTIDVLNYEKQPYGNLFSLGYTCHQLHHETHNLVYTNNIFRICGERFTQMLTTEQLQSITAISVTATVGVQLLWDYGTPRDGKYWLRAQLPFLQQLTGLKRVVMDKWIGKELDAGQMVCTYPGVGLGERLVEVEFEYLLDETYDLETGVSHWTP